MMYKIEISNVDEFEAEHISGILSEYKCRILERRSKAIARNEKNTIAMYDQHLNFHQEMMKKIKYIKETANA
jgi:hypothetical protein